MCRNILSARPYSGEMYHRRTADGRENVWGEYQWTPVCGFPKDSPALGEQIPKGLIQFSEKAKD
ncbi:MAG: hypothetical protein LBG15_12600 [Dysgonamonadaceae bacterium]|nr:hypothetical protein [Dysgonamonadaceae bacterium]